MEHNSNKAVSGRSNTTFEHRRQLLCGCGNSPLMSVTQWTKRVKTGLVTGQTRTISPLQHTVASMKMAQVPTATYPPPTTQAEVPTSSAAAGNISPQATTTIHLMGTMVQTAIANATQSILDAADQRITVAIPQQPAQLPTPVAYVTPVDISYNQRRFWC